eukprot:jgi/Ulvmu1/5182/UM021_0199.1
MTDTLAETVQAPLKRPCNDAIDPNGSDKRQRVELDDPSDILEDVRAVQSTIGEINTSYEKQISQLQENLVAELQAQYAARNPLLAEIPEFWKQTLRNAFRHYLTDLDHTILDDLVQMEIDEPFLPNIQVTLTFADDNQYFASKITRSIVVTEEHRTSHLDVEWKPTQQAAVLQDDVANAAGAFCFFAWFIQSGDDLEDSFDSLITQVWHDPLPYYNSEMEFPAPVDGGDVQEVEFPLAIGEEPAEIAVEEELEVDEDDEDDADIDDAVGEEFLDDENREEEEEEDEEEEDDGDAL